MKKFIFSLLINLLVLGGFAHADSFQFIRYRPAVSCAALTGGKAADLCKQTTDGALYSCVPISGDCDGASEWIAAGQDTGLQLSSTNISTKSASYNMGIGTIAPSAKLDVLGTTKTYRLQTSLGDSYLAANVGIGSTAPGAALDVQGTTRTTGFQLSTGPSSGYVMTSNGQGIGTWAPLGVSSQWITNGSDISYSTGNVGINTVNPQAKFMVNGDVVGIGSITATSTVNALNFVSGGSQTPSIQFPPAVSGDSNYWTANMTDGGGTDNDTFQRGWSATVGLGTYERVDAPNGQYRIMFNRPAASAGLQIVNNSTAAGIVTNTAIIQYGFDVSGTTVVAAAMQAYQEDDFQATGGRDAGLKRFARLDNSLTEYERLFSTGELMLGASVVGLARPSINWGFMSGGTKTIGIERNSTSATAGNDLNIIAGGATVDGSISALNATPTAGGTGYTLDDILTITTGGTGATARVTAVSSGVVTSVTLITWGTGYTTGTGKVTSGGTGSGCTLNITTVRSATNLNGGNTNIGCGTSTGTGTCDIVFKQALAGSTGGADNALSTVGRFKGGNLGIGTLTPGTALDVVGRARASTGFQIGANVGIGTTGASCTCTRFEGGICTAGSCT